MRRVSTLNHGQDPEVQLRELREYCARRGWEVSGEYVDHISGAKDKRAALDRLMADAHRRRFDAVVVWKFDRFARSVSHLLRALETFRVLGIEFVRSTCPPPIQMRLTPLRAFVKYNRDVTHPTSHACWQDSFRLGPVYQLVQSSLPELPFSYCVQF